MPEFQSTALISFAPVSPVWLAEPPDARGLRGVTDFTHELFDDILQEQHPLRLAVRADDAGEVEPVRCMTDMAFSISSPRGGWPANGSGSLQ